MEHLLSIDDIHDHPTLHHLRQTGLNREVRGAILAFSACWAVAVGGGVVCHVGDRVEYIGKRYGICGCGPFDQNGECLTK